MAFPNICWYCIPGVNSVKHLCEPCVSRDKHFVKRVRWDCMALSFIYANILFVSFIFNGYFWSLIFPSTREILVITSVTWYVNEYCLICLTFLFTYPLLYLAPHIRFIFIHWRTGSKHINQIHYNWVFKNHSKCAKNLKNAHPS